MSDSFSTSDRTVPRDCRALHEADESYVAWAPTDLILFSALLPEETRLAFRWAKELTSQPLIRHFEMTHCQTRLAFRWASISQRTYIATSPCPENWCLISDHSIVIDRTVFAQPVLTLPQKNMAVFKTAGLESNQFTNTKNETSPAPEEFGKKPSSSTPDTKCKSTIFLL